MLLHPMCGESIPFPSCLRDTRASMLIIGRSARNEWYKCAQQFVADRKKSEWGYRMVLIPLRHLPSWRKKKDKIMFWHCLRENQDQIMFWHCRRDLKPSEINVTTTFKHNRTVEELWRAWCWSIIFDLRDELIKKSFRLGGYYDEDGEFHAFEKKGKKKEMRVRPLTLLIHLRSP